jgi:hypothetical protein
MRSTALVFEYVEKVLERFSANENGFGCVQNQSYIQQNGNQLTDFSANENGFGCVQDKCDMLK